jgi:hypothetical protein
MTEAQRMYEDYGGCSCHSHPPCSFCMALTEEEADVIWNGSMQDLMKYWREQSLIPVLEKSQWVTIYNYE